MVITKTVFASSTQATPTAATLTSPPPSSNFRATRSPSSPKPTRAIPLEFAPTLTATAKNWASTTSTSSSSTASLESDWTTRYRGVMDVLSEAKQKGVIRAHGVSCHTIGALRAAAASPWVELDLVRLNPIGSHMDADPDTVISTIKQMRAQGKAIVGMKILGQGDLRGKPSEAIRYALSTGVLDAFTIGAESQKEQNDLVQRVAAA